MRLLTHRWIIGLDHTGLKYHIYKVVPGTPLRIAPNVPSSVVPDANPCAQPSTVPTANHDAAADGRVGREPSSRVSRPRTVYDAVTGQQVEPAH